MSSDIKGDFQAVGVGCELAITMKIAFKKEESGICTRGKRKKKGRLYVSICVCVGGGTK